MKGKLPRPWILWRLESDIDDVQAVYFAISSERPESLPPKRWSMPRPWSKAWQGTLMPCKVAHGLGRC